MNVKLKVDQIPAEYSQTSLIISAIVISVIGPSVFIVQPGFVQGLVEQLSLSESQAGYIAAIEMWGIAVSTLALIFLTSKVNWQTLLYASGLCMISGNIISIVFISDVWVFAASRMVVGLGAGCMISLGFSILGITKDPDRNYGYMVMWVLIYGAVVLVLMPTVLERLGMEGLLWFFTVFSTLAFLVIKNIPCSYRDLKYNSPAFRGHYGAAEILSIGSVMIFFTAVGAIWAYLFLIGLSNGSGEQSVANTLMVSQFFGALGAYTAAVVGARFGRYKPIVAGILGCVVPLLMILVLNIPFIYIISICLFNFAYNMTHPYLYAALVGIDPSANIVKYAVGGQMLGIAIGPSIAAGMVFPHNYSNIILLAVTLFSISLTIMLFATHIGESQYED